MPEYWRHWSKEEIKILRKLYGKVPIQELRKVLKDRSVHSIQKKASTLNLHYPTGGEIDYEYLKKLTEIIKE